MNFNSIQNWQPLAILNAEASLLLLVWCRQARKQLSVWGFCVLHKVSQNLVIPSLIQPSITAPQPPGAL